MLCDRNMNTISMYSFSCIASIHECLSHYFSTASPTLGSNKPYYPILDVDPCTNASCKYYSHCVASSPHQFTCVCQNSCPSYEEQVCASNGRTFTNLCLLRKEICRTSGNYTDYHPGSCTGILDKYLININTDGKTVANG